MTTTTSSSGGSSNSRVDNGYMSLSTIYNVIVTKQYSEKQSSPDTPTKQQHVAAAAAAAEWIVDKSTKSHYNLWSAGCTVK